MRFHLLLSFLTGTNLPLSADLSVHSCDFRVGLRLHDHRVLLGGSVWVPGRLQYYSHRHPGVPTGLQVEETPCGSEDTGWVRHALFSFSASPYLLWRSRSSIYYRLLWNPPKNISWTADVGTDTLRLFVQSLQPERLLMCLIKPGNLTCCYLARENKCLTWRVVSPQKSSPCSVRRSSCLFLRRGRKRRWPNNSGPTLIRWRSRSESIFFTSSSLTCLHSSTVSLLFGYSS